MPTEPDASGGLSPLRLSRELLACDDIATALTAFSSHAPNASFELRDAGGLVERYGANPTPSDSPPCGAHFEGKLWSGRCQILEGEGPPEPLPDDPTNVGTETASRPGNLGQSTVLEVWLMLMEQFDRRTAEAWTDPLTGLPNRRWLAFELERRPPALVGFFDVISLQATNREHGHSAGDERLRAAAEALKALGGRAFRVGGDEFVVLLAEAPATTPAIPDGLRGGWGSDLAEAERQMRDS